MREQSDMYGFGPAVDSRTTNDITACADGLAMVGGCPEQVIVSGVRCEGDDGAQHAIPPLPQHGVRLSTGNVTAD